MWFFNKTVTAVDIGTSAIKVARLKLEKSNIKLIDTGYQKLPGDTFINNEIDENTIIIEELEKLFNQMEYSPSHIITSIPNNNLVIRNLVLPGMVPEELSQALKWEADEYLPFPAEEAILDYIVVDREKLQVVLVATENRVVENCLIPFKKLKLYPEVLNVQPLALVSLLKAQKQARKEELPVSGIIEIGASGTRIVITDRDKVYLFRNLDTGGDSFTRRIEDNKNMDYDKAEKYKINKGLEAELEKNEERKSEKAASGTDFNESFNLTEIAAEPKKNLQTEVDNLIEDITKTLDFFSHNHPDKNIEEVYITGGSSGLKGLKDLINKNIEPEIKTLDPFTGLNKPNTFYSVENSVFSVAVGLGYSEVLAD